MFDALEMSYTVLEQFTRIEPAIARKSASLRKQLSDAAESVVLNLGEGRQRRGGDQRRHYEFAAGSASELTAGLKAAHIRGYITAAQLADIDLVLDRVRAMLYKLTR